VHEFLYLQIRKILFSKSEFHRRRIFMLYEDFEDDDVEVLLERFVKNLVSVPEEVELQKTTSPNDTEIITIHVVDDDRGKIIGSGGCIIKSLNTIFHALGCKRGRQLELEIGESAIPEEE
jgi:predicted RNA-binding protein YlqC (UPF0109 family)